MSLPGDSGSEARDEAREFPRRRRTSAPSWQRRSGRFVRAFRSCDQLGGGCRGAGARPILLVRMRTQMSLSRLKWFAIVAPAAFLAVVGYLLRGPFHELLHEFPG